MKNITTLTLGTLAFAALPLVAAAATAVTDLTSAGNFFIGIINNILVPLLFAIAFIVFVWGAFKTFILGATDEKVKDDGKNLMLWGLIGFFVMVSVWGLVNILTNSVTFGNNSGYQKPVAPGIN